MEERRVDLVLILVGVPAEQVVDLRRRLRRRTTRSRDVGRRRRRKLDRRRHVDLRRGCRENHKSTVEIHPSTVAVLKRYLFKVILIFDKMANLISIS